MKPFEIVVDGTNSGGKTPFIEFLIERLINLKYDVVACAPYKKEEVFQLWEKEPLKAARIITRIINKFRNDNLFRDFIIWDRGWPTCWVSTKNKYARQLFLPFPPLTVFLLNTIETTYKKREKYNLKHTWFINENLVQFYNKEYHRIAVEIDAPIISFKPDERGWFDFQLLYKKIISIYIKENLKKFC